MIAASKVSVSFGSEPVLDQVDLTAGSGEMVGLIGPNGSGKTTLLHTLYGALQPGAGLVMLDGRPLAELRPAEVALRIGVVTQVGEGWIPITVGEMVLLGRSPRMSTWQRYTSADRRVANSALARVGVRHLAERPISDLSGGELQRVLIARALTQEADYLLLDEPTNHLDVRFQHEILRLVRSLDVTTVVVLHDLNLAARYCERLVLLDQGRVVSSGPTSQVLAPRVLEPVYGIGMRLVEDDGYPQLVFRPRHSQYTHLDR